jgi:hypothetical protein
MEINVEELLKEQIEQIDVQETARCEIRRLIIAKAEKTIVEMVKDEAAKLVKDAIAECLNGVVKTDDGWGKKAEYGCFGDLFKKTVKEKMESSWDVKRNIEDVIKRRVSDLFGVETQKLADYLTQQIINTAAKENPKPV